jgi:hypothetical protein
MAALFIIVVLLLLREDAVAIVRAIQAVFTL